MDIEEIKKIVETTNEQPNKVLLEAANELYAEFQKTKDIAVKMASHMDFIKDLYDKVGLELKSRNIPENEQ